MIRSRRGIALPLSPFTIRRAKGNDIEHGGLIICLDPYKSSNTIAVLERYETILLQRRFVNSDEGFNEMVSAVADHPERVWAVEGANGMGRYIAQRLVSAGEVVVDVPAKLPTRVRAYSTGHGSKTDKTDKTDAVATARAAALPKHLRFVQPDRVNEALKLVVVQRDQLVATRAQAVGRLHRLTRELIPGGARRELTAEKAVVPVNGLEPGDPAGEMRVEMAMEYIGDIRALDLKVDQVTARINRMVKAPKTTLTQIYGVGPLSAALILDELGNVGRFPPGTTSPATPAPPRSRCPLATPAGSGCCVLGTAGSTRRSMWPR